MEDDKAPATPDERIEALERVMMALCRTLPEAQMQKVRMQLMGSAPGVSRQMKLLTQGHY